jgi:ribosomal protein S18 acetylase RimI-like enzyme
MSELARAVAFEEALRERCAERIVPFRFGRAVFNDTYPDVWDLNVLRVDEPVGATAALLVEEAERLHGEAGHAHRRIALPDEEPGTRLADEFRTFGWQVDCFLYMAYRGDGARSVATDAVEEVGAATLRPLREEISRGEPWGADPGVVQQVLYAGEHVSRTANARRFAVRLEGETASGADLFSDGRTAQIEDVATHPDFRGRGLASAVVLRAAAEALAAGHDFVFLVADDSDWPKELYSRLGFAPLGRKWQFLRQPARGDPA